MDGPGKYAAGALGIAIVVAVALAFTLTASSSRHGGNIVPLTDAGAATPSPSTPAASTSAPVATTSTAVAPPGTTANSIVVQEFVSTMRTYVNHDPDPTETAAFVAEFHREQLAYTAAKAAGKTAIAPVLEAVANGWIQKNHASEILSVQSQLAAQRAAASTSPGGEVAGQARR